MLVAGCMPTHAQLCANGRYDLRHALQVCIDPGIPLHACLTWLLASPTRNMSINLDMPETCSVQACSLHMPWEADHFQGTSYQHCSLGTCLIGSQAPRSTKDLGHFRGT